MRHEMVMPKMGESITEGTIVKWLKKEGDTIGKDEIILEISTDKVDSEIPTPVPGIVEKILSAEGETVEVGKVIAFIETEKISAAADEPPKKADIQEKAVRAKQPEPAVTPTTTRIEVKSEKFFSPVVLAVARTEGISHEELNTITGTGLNGRITKKDVLQYLSEKRPVSTSVLSAPVSEAPAAAAGSTTIIPMDHIRKKIAQHMVQTVHTSPHVGLYSEIDLFTIYNLREKNKHSFKQKEGI